MSDIVQKLRAYRPRYGWPEEYSTIVEPTMNHVAADEIERLRAREARLVKALKHHACHCPDYCCEWGNKGGVGCGSTARAALGEEK
jgi:hypothetical protein